MHIQSLISGYAPAVKAQKSMKNIVKIVHLPSLSSAAKVNSLMRIACHPKEERGRVSRAH